MAFWYGTRSRAFSFPPVSVFTCTWRSKANTGLCQSQLCVCSLKSRACDKECLVTGGRGDGTLSSSVLKISIQDFSQYAKLSNLCIETVKKKLHRGRQNPVVTSLTHSVSLYQKIWFWKLALCDGWRSDESGTGSFFLADFSQGIRGYYTYIFLCLIPFITRFFNKITTLMHIVISEGLNTLLIRWQQTVHMHCICDSS